MHIPRLHKGKDAILEEVARLATLEVKSDPDQKDSLGILEMRAHVAYLEKAFQKRHPCGHDGSTTDPFDRKNWRAGCDDGQSQYIWVYQSNRWRDQTIFCKKFAKRARNLQRGQRAVDKATEGIEKMEKGEGRNSRAMLVRRRGGGPTKLLGRTQKHDKMRPPIKLRESYSQKYTIPVCTLNYKFSSFPTPIIVFWAHLIAPGQKSSDCFKILKNCD